MAGAKGLHDTAIEDHKTYGDSVLSRLAGAPKALAPRVKAFAAAHKAWRSADDAAQAAKKKRDAAIAAIGAADDAQDASIDDLCVEIVGARMGDRKNPLAKFTKHAPSELKALADETEAKTIGDVARAIEAAKPNAAVKKACARARAAAGKTHAAIVALAPVQQKYDEGLAARDALLPDWIVTLRRLKKSADAEWVDAPAKYKAAFAPPPKVAAPKKKRAKKKIAPPPPPETPPAT